MPAFRPPRHFQWARSPPRNQTLPTETRWKSGGCSQPQRRCSRSASFCETRNDFGRFCSWSAIFLQTGNTQGFWSGAFVVRRLSASGHDREEGIAAGRAAVKCMQQSSGAQQSSACSGQVIDRQIISGKKIGKIRRFSRWKKPGSQMVRCCNAQMKDVPVGRRGAVTVSAAGDYGKCPRQESRARDRSRSRPRGGSGGFF